MDSLLSTGKPNLVFWFREIEQILPSGSLLGFEWHLTPRLCIFKLIYPFRTKGASAAAKLGAVAVLIRSVASFSIYSPHTGQQYYEDGVPQIPTASITVEDAQLLHRIQVS